MAVLAFQVGYQSAIAISPLGHMVALSSTEPVQPHRPHSLLALPLAGPGLRLQIAMGLILRTHSDLFFFFFSSQTHFFWQPHVLYSLWNSPGQNTGVGSHSILQGSSQPRDRPQVSCIAGGFFTSWATWEAPRHIFFPRVTHHPGRLDHRPSEPVISSQVMRLIELSLQPECVLPPWVPLWDLFLLGGFD